MTDLPRVARLLETMDAAPDDRVVLDYDARLLRRKRLVGAQGLAFMVDLPEVTSLDPFAAFALTDGRRVAIEHANESVLVITGNLPRLAWHIGNRHTPCQMFPDRLVIREDHVLEAMLRGLGAQVARAHLPFAPEGGAYGHGRTMGHAHDHGHEHSHDHAHDHAHHHGA